VKTWLGLTAKRLSARTRAIRIGPRTLRDPAGLVHPRGSFICGNRASRHQRTTGFLASGGAVEPSIDIPLGIVLRHTIALLKAAGELSPFALDHIKIVVGEFAPLLLNLPLNSFQLPST
jgi:hypothetical protein